MRTFLRFSPILLTISVVLLLAAFLGGCSRDRVDDSLENTEWRLVQLHGHDLLPGTHITMEITEKYFSGFSGCNHYGSGGDFRMNSGTIEVESIVSNLKDCGDAIDRQESQFQKELYAGVVTYEIIGDRLLLFDSDGHATLVFERLGNAAAP